jgi:hypothetical protein
MAEPLFPKALRGISADGGDSYDLLPSEIKAMHHVENVLVAKGKADVTRDKSPLAKLAARAFGFPQEGHDIPVEVTFTRTESGETLRRDFNGEVFTTSFYDPHKPGHLIERFGPLWFLIECVCSAQGIDMIIRKFWLWNLIPLPMCLGPRINATERVEAGQYRFDVDIRLPIIGRVIHYRGWLSIA